MKSWDAINSAQYKSPGPFCGHWEHDYRIVAVAAAGVLNQYTDMRARVAKTNLHFNNNNKTFAHAYGFCPASVLNCSDPTALNATIGIQERSLRPVIV